MRTKLALWIIMIVVLCASAFAQVTVNNDFYYGYYDNNGDFQETNQPLTNVKAIGFVCTDGDCTGVSSVIFNGQTLNSGSNNRIQMTYPKNKQYAPGAFYGVYAYKDGYIPWEIYATWYGTGTVSQVYDGYLSKIQTCAVGVDTFSVINDVHPNQPVMVEVMTSLDTNVMSPIIHAGYLDYVPPQIQRQYQVDTKVIVEILNENNQVVHTQSQNVLIDYSGEERVEFTYEPDQTGEYTARVYTIVDDDKCLSTNSHEATQTFSVIPTGPTNQCYTLIDNLETPVQQCAQNQPNPFSFEKVSNYYDANGNLHVLPTQAEIKIFKNGQQVYSDTVTIPANTNINDYFKYDFTWTPSQSGWHVVQVKGTALNCPYSNNIMETETITVYVQEPQNQACTGPDGATIAHGSSKTYFYTSGVGYGQTCVDEIRTCNNGVLSGSYQYATCQPEQPQSCTGPDGSTIPHDSSKTYFYTSSVPYGQTCNSQTRVCTNGVLSGSFQFSSCTVEQPQNHAPVINGLPDQSIPTNSANDNLFDLDNYASDVDGDALFFTIISQTNTAVAQCTIDAFNFVDCTGKSQVGCSLVTVRVSDGQLTDTDSFNVCTSYTPQSCIGPDGSTIAHGSSKTYFYSNSVGYGQTCQSETRTCNDGHLSGSYQFASCSQQPPASCTGPNNEVIPHGGSLTYFQTSFVPFGDSCDSQVRTCNNGVLSGSFTKLSCVVLPPASCNGPDGSTIQHGTSKLYFKDTSVGYGQQCESEYRTCHNGQLSGSFTKTSCTVENPDNCIGPNNEQILHGDSKVFFSTSSVGFGQTCNSEVRVCTDGTLSGSFTFATCNQQPPASCTGPDGSTIAHGSSKTYFFTSSVPYGQTCNGEPRVCYDGALSGSYQFATCQPEQPQDCVGPNNQTIPHGTSQIFYKTKGGVCESEVRSCTDGTLTGSFTFSSCVANGAPNATFPDVIMQENEGTRDVLTLPTYISDPENDPLTVEIISQSATDIVVCNLDVQAHLICTTKANKYGTSIVMVKISDQYSSIKRPIKVIVQRDMTLYTGPQLSPEQDRVEENLYIAQFKVLDDVRPTNTGDLHTFIDLRNEGEIDFTDVRVTISFPELGLVRKIGPFDLDEEEVYTRELFFPTTHPVQPGYYTVRMSIRTAEDVHRIVHREVLVRD